MQDTVRVGDVFQCKRRGHEVVVKNLIANTVYYPNARGSVVRIHSTRLLNPIRFRRVVAHAQTPIPEGV